MDDLRRRKRTVRPATGADGKPALQTFKVTFDSDKSPPRLTVHTSTEICYIHEVNDDTLWLCSFSLIERDGAEVVAWPTMFSTDHDKELFPRLEVWKRVKDNH